MRDLEEEEESWFDKDDDDMSTTSSMQAEERLKPAKWNDVAVIESLNRTPNNSVTTLNATNSTPPLAVAKMTDSPTKTTPLTSITSVAPSVNSRKVKDVFHSFKCSDNDQTVS